MGLRQLGKQAMAKCITREAKSLISATSRTETAGAVYGKR
jgi:hypothetical protein